jgi:hypothetical protein
MLRRLRDFRPAALKQDPFLLVILVFIGLLVIASLVLFFLRQAAQDYLSESSPQAVVHNYLLAIHRGDLERAYSYLVEADDKPDFEQFKLTFLTLQQDLSQVYVQVGEVRQSGEAVSISLTVTHASGNPFRSAWEDSGQAVLFQDDAGVWKIQSLPYPFWGLDWYGSGPKPMR